MLRSIIFASFSIASCFSLASESSARFAPAAVPKIHAFGKPPEHRQNRSMELKVVKSINPILQNITNDYDIGVLKNNMDSDAFSDNYEQLKLGLKRASSLGKMQNCRNINFGYAKDMTDTILVKGTCPFHEGKGVIQFLLSKNNEDYPVIYFDIQPLT